MEIAVVGSGIAGLGAAWLLKTRHRVTIFEQAATAGGHSHTVDAPRPDGTTQPVDTGFIVYNERTYPNLVRLFDHLGVATEPSDMSFAVSLDGGRLEYAGDETLRGLFVQPGNLLKPSFLHMVGDILRFFRTAPAVLDDPRFAEVTLGDYLAAHRYGKPFVLHHLLPMAAAIWSAPFDDVTGFPVRTFVRFFHNHGLLKLAGRPRWRTVSGGSRSYVSQICDQLGDGLRLGCPIVSVGRAADGVRLRDAAGTEHRFDQVVLATHGDQARALLADASEREAAMLGSFRYQTNRAVLHRDPAQMPKRRAAWCSWNYLGRGLPTPLARVSVTYWMNRLQSIDPADPLFVTLNPLDPPRADLVVRDLRYQHPIFDQRAVAAQARMPSIQGQGGVWYCGAYMGYGFHEDGLSSGLAVAEALGCRRPWQVEELSPAGRHATPGPAALAPLPAPVPLVAE